jgi:hypothetical protein
MGEEERQEKSFAALSAAAICALQIPRRNNFVVQSTTEVLQCYFAASFFFAGHNFES